MAINIVDQFKRGFAGFLDVDQSQPTVAAALVNIPSGVRRIGYTVFIEDLHTEYWFKNGIADTDFVEKLTGSGAIPPATETEDGLMPHTDKAKLNAIDPAVNLITATERTNWNDKYTRAETDNAIAAVVTSLDWKESVTTYADIATTYPTPEDGWTVNVRDTNLTYRYTGTEWIVISANAIPNATTAVDGLMSHEDKTKLDGLSPLAPAAALVLGGVRVGTNLSIDADGVLSAEGGGTYENASPSLIQVGGIAPGRTFAPATSLQSILTDMFYPYQRPQASLTNNNAGTWRLRGQPIPSSTLTMGTTKRSRNITAVNLLRGSTVIHTPDPILPNGGNYSHVDNTPISDTTSWTLQVSDGTETATASVTVNFNDPTFVGVWASPADTDVSVLSQFVTANRANRDHGFTASGHLVFMYPASWGNLSAIIDQNNFNVTSGYTVEERNVVVPSGTLLYRCYIKTVPAVIEGTFTLHFNF